jgi:hypothetical protein
MIIRPFDWRDLPTLIRYRRQGFFFDTPSLLTRGEFIVPANALLSYFAAATGIFTYLCKDKETTNDPLLGQVSHNQGDQIARLLFLAPEASFDSDALLALLEYIVQKIGERGALHLMAEIDERTTAFENLRKAGFALYVHQRIWKFKDGSENPPSSSQWRDIAKGDVIAVRTLYNTLVPPLVQQVESLPTDQMNGFVYFQDGELLAYAEVKYGQRGIWLQPFIHPDTSDVDQRIKELLYNLPNRHSRPIYLCVRSYQSWLEHSLDDMPAEVGPNQAVMVKHLAVAKKARESFTLPALEGGQQEITTPFVRSEGNK